MLSFPISKTRIVVAALCAASFSPLAALADDAPLVQPVTQPALQQPIQTVQAPAANQATPPAAPAPSKPDSNNAYNAIKARQARFEKAVRGLMAQTGFADAAVQDAVIAHMQGESRARRPLRQSGEKLFLALQSPAVTDEQMTALLKNFQAALDADDLRRLAAEKALDEKIGYAKNPRLQSMLVLFGIIGDDALFVPLREPPQGSYANPGDGKTATLEATKDSIKDSLRRPDHATEYPQQAKTQ